MCDFLHQIFRHLINNIDVFCGQTLQSVFISLFFEAWINQQISSKAFQHWRIWLCDIKTEQLMLEMMAPSLAMILNTDNHFISIKKSWVVSFKKSRLLLFSREPTGKRERTGAISNEYWSKWARYRHVKTYWNINLGLRFYSLLIWSNVWLLRVTR